MKENTDSYEEGFYDDLIEETGEELEDELKEILPKLYSEYLKSLDDCCEEEKETAYGFMDYATREIGHALEKKYKEFLSPDDIQEYYLEFYKTNNKGKTQ